RPPAPRGPGPRPPPRQEPAGVRRGVPANQPPMGVKVPPTGPGSRLRVVDGSPHPAEHPQLNRSHVREYTASSHEVPTNERRTDARTSPPTQQTDRYAQPRAPIARTYSPSITAALRAQSKTTAAHARSDPYDDP